MHWDYFDKFDEVNNKYLPWQGQGDTMATQIATAVNKIIYKFYNDGDVFDNTHYLKGWCNDLSSYANWLYKYVDNSNDILNRIEVAKTEKDYEDMLVSLADTLLDKDFLEEMNKIQKVGTVYECDGPFEYQEYYGDEDEDDDYDYDEYEDEDEEEEEEY